MAGNTFGKNLRLTTFGESHGKAIGGILDGFPSNIQIDFEAIQNELDRRRPGQSTISTPRNETDTVEFLSGIFEGKSTGTPIGFIIQNKDQRTNDYSEIKDKYRPSHADYTYHKKYEHYDYRGGGRSSARETACRVVGGAFAKQLLASKNITITAWVQRVQNIEVSLPYSKLNLSLIEENIVRCPDEETAFKMINLIEQTKKEGDSLGGTIRCIIEGVDAGLGEPVFDKLHAQLGKAMLSINAVKGFEYGSGFAGTYMKGSEHNDILNNSEAGIHTETNYSGGIQGGISNGEDITMQIAFKPVATIMKQQKTINNEGENTLLSAKGRHDPCVLPRAVPIVEAMAALVIADFINLTS